MKATKLHNYCRFAVSAPRKRPRLAYVYDNALSPSQAGRQATTKPFSSCASRFADLYKESRDRDQEVELAQRQLDQLQLNEDFTAAPAIDFRAKDSEPNGDRETSEKDVMRKLRVVPESPSYFSGRPHFNDDYIELQSLLRKYNHLPTVPSAEAGRIAWQDYKTYKESFEEPIKPSRYKLISKMLKRMHLIHPKLMPAEVKMTLQKWVANIQPFRNTATPILIDEYGRAGAVGRRKSSSAKAWVVEGEGEVLVNGKPLHQTFARVHDRESVIWALKATQRVEKYNVFAMVHGGGTTGQAEALTLAVSKALIAHEPSLKTLLRNVGCVARDPRRVERKKPGHLKARKKPAWVKR